MYVDTAQTRELQNLEGQNLSIGNYNNDVRSQRRQIGNRIPCSKRFWLKYGNSIFLSQFLHRRSLQTVSSPFGFIWLGIYGANLITVIQQNLQGRHGKIRSPHKQYTH